MHTDTTILSVVKTWWLFETSAEDYTAAPACRAANQPASLSFLLILSRNCSLKAQSDDSRRVCVLFHWNRTKSLSCLVKMSTLVFVFFCSKLIVIPNLFSSSTAPPSLLKVFATYLCYHSNTEPTSRRDSMSVNAMGCCPLVVSLQQQSFDA